MVYMEWQINDNKAPLAESVIKAMEYHANKYGRVPNIVECSWNIPREQIPHFEGVMFRLISIPKNILLLGIENSSSTNVADVE